VLKECIEMYYSCQTDHRDDEDLDFDHFIYFAYKVSGRQIKSSSVIEDSIQGTERLSLRNEAEYRWKKLRYLLNKNGQIMQYNT